MPTYNVLRRSVDGLVLDYNRGGNFDSNIQGADVAEYTADNPPEIGGIIDEEGVYTAPTDNYYVHLEWDGGSSGSASKSDGVWEMTSNGGNRAYLNISLRDGQDKVVDDNSSEFTFRIVGSLSVDPSYVKVALTAGTAQAYFTPTSGVKGDQIMYAVGINNSYKSEEIRIRIL